MFHVGQKVVCIGPVQGVKASMAPLEYRLTTGGIYTIRDFDVRATHIHRYPTVRLVEVVRPVIFGCDIGMWWEVGYIPQVFRPIVEKKTDISVFEEILKRETVDDHQPSVAKTNAG